MAWGCRLSSRARRYPTRNRTGGMCVTRRALQIVSGGAATGNAGVGACVSGTVRRPTANGGDTARPGAVRVAGARRLDVAAGITVTTAEPTAEDRGARAPPGGIVGTRVFNWITGAGIV